LRATDIYYVFLQGARNSKTLCHMLFQGETINGIPDRSILEFHGIT
jgi:hypothetical protein